MLRAYVTWNQNEWHVSLAPLEFTYNNSLQSSTGITPFELVYGDWPIIPTSVLNLDANKPMSVAATDTFLSDMLLKLRLAQDALVSAQTIQAKQANKKHKDITDFHIGDLVWLNSQHINLKNVPKDTAKKLQHCFLGPFPIIKIVVLNTMFKLELPVDWKIHPVFHVSKLKKHIEDMFENRKSL